LMKRKHLMTEGKVTVLGMRTRVGLLCAVNEQCAVPHLLSFENDCIFLHSRLATQLFLTYLSFWLHNQISYSFACSWTVSHVPLFGIAPFFSYQLDKEIVLLSTLSKKAQTHTVFSEKYTHHLSSLSIQQEARFQKSHILL